MFNGTTQIIGAATSDANGERYMSIIGKWEFIPSPIRINIDSFDPATGSVSATVTMYSSTDVVNGTFNFILTEDDLTVEDTEVTRLLYTEPISLSGLGSTAVVSTTFAIDPGWNQANLHVIAFVQKADKAMVQAASTYPQPTYKVRAMVPFSRNVLGPSSGTYIGEDFSLFNLGSANTYDVNLVIDQTPPGWTAEYCDAADNCYSTPTSVSLTQGELADYYVKVMPTSRGFMIYHLEVSSAATGTMTMAFNYITDDVDVLVVDDDGGEDYEDYFTSALNAAGFSCGVWDLAKGKTTAEVTDVFPVLVWTTGLGYPDAIDRAFLRGHLDQGKSLFITGQDIGWGLARATYGEDPTFVYNYLHANYIRDDTNLYDLTGVAGDPVSDGIDLHIEGGDGANNQEYPDEIAPRDADATTIFSYVADGVGAVRSVDSISGAKVVYFGFGYEAIDNATDRAALMDSIVGWLSGIFADDFEDGTTDAWSAVIP